MQSYPPSYAYAPGMSQPAPEMWSAESHGHDQEEEEGYDDDYQANGAGGAIPNYKRRQTKKACMNCRNDHAACDSGRPCSRCVKYGIGDSCRDAVRKRKVKTASPPNGAAAPLMSQGHHPSAHSHAPPPPPAAYSAQFQLQQQYYQPSSSYPSISPSSIPPPSRAAPAPVGMSMSSSSIAPNPYYPRQPQPQQQAVHIVDWRQAAEENEALIAPSYFINNSASTMPGADRRFSDPFFSSSPSDHRRGSDTFSSLSPFSMSTPKPEDFLPPSPNPASFSPSRPTEPMSAASAGNNAFDPSLLLVSPSSPSSVRVQSWMDTLSIPASAPFSSGSNHSTPSAHRNASGSNFSAASVPSTAPSAAHSSALVVPSSNNQLTAQQEVSVLRSEMAEMKSEIRSMRQSIESLVSLLAGTFAGGGLNPKQYPAIAAHTSVPAPNLDSMSPPPSLSSSTPCSSSNYSSSPARGSCSSTPSSGDASVEEQQKCEESVMSGSKFVEIGQEASAVWDRDEKILHCTEMFQQMLQLEEPEVLDMAKRICFQDIVDPKAYACSKRCFSTAMYTGCSAFDRPIILVRYKDKKEMKVMMRCSLLMNGSDFKGIVTHIKSIAVSNS